MISAEINDAEYGVCDIEDITGKANTNRPTLINKINLPTESSLTSSKSTAIKRKHDQLAEAAPKCNWKSVMGEPPKFSTIPKELKAWVAFHKRKWQIQMDFRRANKKNSASTQFNPNIGRSLTDFVMKTATTKAQVCVVFN